MASIKKILIANRGEIAVRIMRTCADMGISTVAVCSEADLLAPHVLLADESVLLGAAPAAESYLNISRVIDAALRTGADAVHPGYGFLSENAAFAQACSDAGLIFIGPRPETIELMGSKARARALMQERGVPVVPGYDGEDQDEATLMAAATDIGFPVLVKASAGGGGKGMRVVASAGELGAALAAARREALSAFGDARLLLERYIERPRHIEVQILGDEHGQVVHLYERDCSVQRRHQKVIEESPSPAVDDALREDLVEAAVEAGEACDYVGAGTVEFILAPDGQFYFLEVNTRLQVEHPVTEMVLGLDLVRLQIEVAEGRPLELDPRLIEPMGHAIECRVYAEDAEHGFLPATGQVLEWSEPDAPWLRIDSGVHTGSEVGIYYDPMLAKVITHADSREEALRRMSWALERLRVLGVTTNLAFLRRVIDHPAFVEGDVSTHFIEEHAASLRPAAPQEALMERVAAATLAEHALRRGADAHLPEVPAGWRNNRPSDPAVVWTCEQGRVAMTYRHIGPLRYRLSADGWLGDARILSVDGAGEDGGWDGPVTLRLLLNGRLATWRVARQGARMFVAGPDGVGALSLDPRFPKRSGAGSAGGAIAPMPGKILTVQVQLGDTVEAGQALVILEAMKMEHTLTAERDGEVSEVRARVGDVVEAGAVLVVISAA